MDLEREKSCVDAIESEGKEREFPSKLKGFGSFSAKDMLFRADKVDLKSLDIQLEKRLTKAWSKGGAKKPKEEWEIDLSKLEIRYEVARGTYGTVYRGIYDGQDVAGTLGDHRGAQGAISHLPRDIAAVNVLK